MNKQQRSVYVTLAKEIDTCLCTWCKFNSGGCEEQECDHPLSERLESAYHREYYGIEPGADCWGFRPWASVPLAADITGIVLAQGFESWVYFREDSEHPLPMVKGSTEGEW